MGTQYPECFDLRQQPVREGRTPGSARGAAGNSRPYRDHSAAAAEAMDAAAHCT